MLKMGHVQDPALSTNMILIVCMIYHMKVHMFGYNLGPQKMSKSKFHILTISEPISMKPAIVMPAPLCFRTIEEKKCARKLLRSKIDGSTRIFGLFRTTKPH